MPGIDLDAFNPEQSTVRFRGIDYLIPGDIPLTMIIEATQYEGRLREVEADARKAMQGGDIEKLKEIGAAEKGTLEAMYALCMKLLRLENPDCPDLDLTAENCGTLLAMMASGGLRVDVDESILEAIAGPKDERRPPARSRTKKPPTSRSGKPSRSRSSA